ncbi:unnamed protein product [Scytosiphon promiscuus]
MPGDTPSQQEPPPPRLRWKVVAFFVYSILQAVFSVWNALATGSFSSTSGYFWEENVVFYLSAVSETSGLAFGIGMATRQYTKAGDQSLWSDMLSEPYVLAFEGMFAEGERGRALFLQGLKGTVCQGLVVMIFYTAGWAGSDVGPILYIVFLCALLLAILIFDMRSLTNYELVIGVCVYSFFVSLVLGVEALEIRFLLRSGTSFQEGLLVLVDALAILPITIVILVLSAGGPLYGLYKLTRGTARRCCPSTCGSLSEGQYPRAARAKSFFKRHLVAMNIFDADETTANTNASPVPTV